MRGGRLRQLLNPGLHGKRATNARRILAALLFLAAAVLAVSPQASAGKPGVPTVVAAHHLTSGVRLHAADLRIAHYPADLRPTGAHAAVGEVAGRVIAGSLASGEPVTSARLTDGRAGPQGTSTVPIRLADPAVAGLLHPGTRVDVITEGEEERVVASMAAVLTVTTPADGSGSARDDGPLVLLAVPKDAATRLAAASLRQPLTVTLRSPS